MFSIDYKISTKREDLKRFNVDELNFDGMIEGYFQISIGSLTEGYYTDDTKYEEYGNDLITEWFLQLVRVASGCTTQKYVTVKILETGDLWLEFERINENSILVRSVAFNGNEMVVYHKSKKRKIRSEANENISLDELLSVIARSCQKYVDELYQINPNFLKTEDILEIINWLEEYKKSAG